MIIFSYPWLLLQGCIILPVIVWILYRRYHRMKELYTILQHSMPSLICYTKAWHYILLCIFFLFIIIASSDPILYITYHALRPSSLEAVLLFDVSQSMGVIDYQQSISRFTKAKSVGKQLLTYLEGNIVGLVIFAGKAFVQSPLIHDISALQFILEEWIYLRPIQHTGSNIHEGLTAAISLFSSSSGISNAQVEHGAKQRYIILFSDGGNINTVTEDMIHRIQQHNIFVIVIGVGKSYPSRVPVIDSPDKWVVDDQKNPIFSSYDQQAIVSFVSQIHGQFVSLQENTQFSDVTALFPRSAARQSHAIVLYPYLVLCSLLFFLLHFYYFS